MSTVHAVSALRRPVEAVVRPPGSKSLTNRALVVAALAGGGVSRLHGPLDADDTQVMRAGLANMGTSIDDNDDPWLVLGTDGRLGGGDVDCRASGTTARFLTAVAALASRPVTIDGTRRLRERPIGPLVVALRSIGADIEGDSLPLTVRPSTLRGGEVQVDASASSQFLSAMLMLAPMLPSGATIRPVGAPTSRSYVAGTVEMMRALGARVDSDGTMFAVEGSGYRRAHIDIEADASAAVYPMLAAAVTGGTVAIDGIPETSSQPDLAMCDVLERMGCVVVHTGERILVQGPEGPLRAIDIDLSSSPDASLAVAVAALFADGPSRLAGLATLRLKETDRLLALSTEIRRIGAWAAVDGDALVITPADLGPAQIETYDDHRMAMSFAVAGLRVPGVEIRDPDCVSKTWPGFFAMLDAL